LCLGVKVLFKGLSYRFRLIFRVFDWVGFVLLYGLTILARYGRLLRFIIIFRHDYVSY
jgi:hypothetical protein